MIAASSHTATRFRRRLHFATENSAHSLEVSTSIGSHHWSPKTKGWGSPVPGSTARRLKTALPPWGTVPPLHGHPLPAVVELGPSEQDVRVLGLDP